MSGLDQQYWQEYNNFQRVKHDLIHEYLKGWFPKLGLKFNRILYLDTHAGRGRHITGEYGSPLVALSTVLEHAHRDMVLSGGREMRFNFVERDEDNYNSLQQEIEAFGELPKQITHRTHEGDCFTLLERIIAWIDGDRQNRVAPTFAFVDPYGFRVPCDTLRRFMRIGHVELFINVIWRELNMSISLAKQMPNSRHVQNLNTIFGGADWLDTFTSDNAEERAEQAIELFRTQIGARWATRIKMLGDNGATRYMLLHLTNSDDGRDLMKDCMWKVCPDGGFYARKSDNPNQAFLIEPEPDLRPLREWLLELLAERPYCHEELVELVREQVWREPHLNRILRELRNKKTIEASNYQGRFSFNQNPLFTLSA